MVESRAGLWKTAFAGVFLLSLLPISYTLFDSVWIEDDPDEISVDYTDGDSGQDFPADDSVASKLGRMFFPDLDLSAFRSPDNVNIGVSDEVEGVWENEPKIEASREKRQKMDGIDKLKPGIPAKFTLLVELGDDSEDELQKIREAIASVLSLPLSHIHQSNQHTLPGQIGLYFTKRSSAADSVNVNDLIPASQIEGSLSSAGVHIWQRSVDTEGVQAQVKGPLAVPQGGELWDHPYFPVIVAVGVLVLMTAVGTLVWCCLRKKKDQPEKTALPTQQSALLSTPIPQQICLYPAAKPSVNSATAIQPDAPNTQADVTQILASRAAYWGGFGTPLSGSGTGSPSYSSSSQSGTPIPGTPVHTPPLRIKARGLLERRGSNASLTLELGTGPSAESSHMGSPPKESSAEEYLLSAGNRMSRRQLQRCLSNVKAIYSEFWEIPMNHPDRIIMAGSGMKNRYRTIIPNEITRVVLPEMEGDLLSSYINANYIRGYGGERRAYIATQGPMSNTVIDFWRMIWQEKAPIIVMITKLKEKNKNKCENYVPDYHDTFGDIDVLVEGISEKEGYIIRRLRLRHKGEEHELLHYWYTTWPDHKAPNTARQLLALVKQIDIQRRDTVTHITKGPVVIHCSAGIGRTGCFIAASIGIQQLQEEHMVDILGIVCNMRLDRGGMVQTNEQYEFVHQALVLYEQELPEKPPCGD